MAVERSVIHDVFPGRSNALDLWGRVNFLAEGIMAWSFLTQRPLDVLDTAETLGYRFVMTTESHDDAPSPVRRQAMTASSRTLGAITALMVAVGWALVVTQALL